MFSPPSRAVPWDDQRRLQIGEGAHGATDDRFERRTTEVKATDKGVQSANSGEPLGVPHDVDGAGVCTAGQDHETLASKMNHHGLIIDNERVWLPGGSGPRLMRRRHSVLEIGRSVHLTGDQDRALDQ